MGEPEGLGVDIDRLEVRFAAGRAGHPGRDHAQPVPRTHGELTRFIVAATRGKRFGEREVDQALVLLEAGHAPPDLVRRACRVERLIGASERDQGASERSQGEGLDRRDRVGRACGPCLVGRPRAIASAHRREGSVDVRTGHDPW